METIFRQLMGRPVWFAIVVALALALLPVAVWLDLRHLSEVALKAQATSLNSMITDIRGYYANNVVGRVIASGGRTIAAHNYAEIPGAIPIPATLSLELGEVIGRRGENMQYRFVSDLTFGTRVPHRLDDFERRALERFRSDENGRSLITAISGSMFDRRIRLAAPVVMGEACVSCHNSHPESPKRDWKVGDVRGIQEVEIAQPIAANLFSFKYLLLYFAGAGLFGVGFASMQWRQARTFGRMNRELEEANSFLASVSMKISKYLSPQVYRSIFSGERDVTISTERKKLTIFFSDIKDFTVTSERLQPEELTQILNEYFTEMAKIAMAHGATVDKFIGDAILAFFGDPDTKGTREDAKACVEMAIAMQRRMLELNATWRRRGIEKPFQARMGINTGFCNVGNFGSADRMDYTIIGAEANLAARLEQIAEPGGIVMSYETYAHVEDAIRAKPLPPISLKGISREVVPYAVEGIHLEQTSGKVFDESVEGARIFLDPDRLPEVERERLRGVLAQAVAALTRQGPLTS
ncbi:MAG TPA: adenylate/guanylate cyclase domain-containing protein [Aurantimonas sp.]|uniref:Adenylate/guanylate cyclase domain-containing protein n=1 Tax=Aurantimonas marianensis TaxID=2920428 RepID=A0A9X2H347_9HYPH|nr:adenylate/guanylate cyclase domain-containing protein [Aurantimonas marianensis]MCP3054765.1 adenylate/guanylate cyclase domain-containing protein [Aurantimonas marianensis]